MGSPARAQSWENDSDADRDVVLRVRGGDRDAFAEIVEVHKRRVYGVAVRMTRRHEVADDIAQETFIRAFKSLDRFELGRPLGPWLVKIAVNLSLNYLSNAARREQSLYTEDTPDGPATPGVRRDPSREPLESNPHRKLQSRELVDALERAVDKLKPDHRAVFLLKVNEGMAYDEIAAALEISRGTVMSRLHRARGELKKWLEDYR